MPILKSVKIARENTVAVAVKTFLEVPVEVYAEPVNPDGSVTDETPVNSPEILLAQTQAQIEAMLQAAQTHVLSIQEEAAQAGWARGYEDATRAAEQELGKLIGSIKKIANAAVEQHNQFLRLSQNEIGRFAVAIAEKIIGQELSINSKIVTDIVAQAIKEANITGACRIRVNPADYELLSPAWDSIPSLQPSERRWELLADKKIAAGGCVIEADGGILDAQIESQLAQVSMALDKLNS